MSWVDLLATRARLTVGLALLMMLAGVWAWFAMPREEDPRLPERGRHGRGALSGR